MLFLLYEICGFVFIDFVFLDQKWKHHPFLIHIKKKAIFHCKTVGYNPNQDTLHRLQRHQQTIIFRLRTGRCRLNSHQEDWRKDLCSMPLWRGRPNTRTLPTVLLTPSASKAADMASLCVPQNQALGVCRGFVPDIQVCSSHRREDLVNATITSNTEEEELQKCKGDCQINGPFC